MSDPYMDSLVRQEQEADLVEQLMNAPVLYPFPMSMDTLQIRYHVQTWWKSLLLWGDLPHGIMSTRSECLLFSDRRDRAKFAKFWKRYESWFQCVSPRRAFFAYPKAGIIKGGSSAFVEFIVPSSEHHVAWCGLNKNWTHADNIQRINGDKPWEYTVVNVSWLMHHVKSPVYLIPGGLFFTSAKDAALWTLYTDERKERQEQLKG